MRDQGRRDALSPPARRHPAALEPRFARRNHCELAHPDDAPGRFSNEKWPRPVGDPRIEDVGYSIVAAPERPHRREHIAFVFAACAADQQIHGAILP